MILDLPMGRVLNVAASFFEPSISVPLVVLMRISHNLHLLAKLLLPVLRDH